MELIVKGSFLRDVSAFTSKELLNDIHKAIRNIELAGSINKIAHLKKLQRYDIYYRIKIAENYRIGIIIRKNKIWFVCFGHRNNFYKKFP